MIIACTCKSPGQDAIHGKGNRVHNPMGKSTSDSSKWRCTGCAKSNPLGAVKTISGQDLRNSR